MNKAMIVAEMKDHGGHYNEPGEYRFKIVSAFWESGERASSLIGKVVGPEYLKRQTRAGVVVKIVQTGTYPAPPGLRRNVIKLAPSE